MLDFLGGSASTFQTVARTYNKLERTKSMVNVALQAAKLREESERLAAPQ